MSLTSKQPVSSENNPSNIFVNTITNTICNQFDTDLVKTCQLVYNFSNETTNLLSSTSPDISDEELYSILTQLSTIVNDLFKSENSINDSTSQTGGQSIESFLFFLVIALTILFQGINAASKSNRPSRFATVLFSGANTLNKIKDTDAMLNEFQTVVSSRDSVNFSPSFFKAVTLSVTNKKVLELIKNNSQFKSFIKLKILDLGKSCNYIFEKSQGGFNKQMVDLDFLLHSFKIIGITTQLLFPQNLISKNLLNSIVFVKGWNFGIQFIDNINKSTNLSQIFNKNDEKMIESLLISLPMNGGKKKYTKRKNKKIKNKKINTKKKTKH
tara:strand:- start:1629 stop:2609 length:981 start_codon:yes stop_codon:yes gene_type:complete